MGAGREGGGWGIDGFGSLTVGGVNSTGITCLNPGEYSFRATLSGASAANPLRLNLYSGAQFTLLDNVAVTNIGPVTLDNGTLELANYGTTAVNRFSDTAPLLANGGLIEMNNIYAGAETVGALAVQSGATRVNVVFAGSSFTFSGVNFSAGSGRGTVMFTGDQGSGSLSNPLGGGAAGRRVFLTGVAAATCPRRRW